MHPSSGMTWQDFTVFQTPNHAFTSLKHNYHEKQMSTYWFEYFRSLKNIVNRAKLNMVGTIVDHFDTLDDVFGKKFGMTKPIAPGILTN